MYSLRWTTSQRNPWGPLVFLLVTPICEDKAKMPDAGVSANDHRFVILAATVHCCRQPKVANILAVTPWHVVSVGWSPVWAEQHLYVCRGPSLAMSWSSFPRRSSIPWQMSSAWRQRLRTTVTVSIPTLMTSSPQTSCTRCWSSFPQPLSPGKSS